MNGRRSPYGSIVMLLMVPAMATIGGPAYPQDRADRSPHASTSPFAHHELQTIEKQIQATIRNVTPAIVAIGNRFGRNPQSVLWEGKRFSSGVIIREDGLILSQYHVSHKGVVDFEGTGLHAYGKPGDIVDVILHDGRRMEGELLGGEPQADLSLLRLKEPGKYPFVTLHDGEMKLGDWVLKLGHPLGYQPARGSSARIGRLIYANPVNLIADCMVSGGDSGGPLFDGSGRVIAMVQDSFMPYPVALAASDRDFPMAYMTSSKIQRKMGSMLAGSVPHETTFEDHEERKRAYEKTKANVSKSARRDSDAVLAGWRNVAALGRGSVIEILNPQQKRVAYGAIVDSNGWILSKASVVPEYPSCRLSDGELLQAHIVGVDRDLDLALLRIPKNELNPVRWSQTKTYLPGTLVMTSDPNGNPLSSGIVSVSTHDDPICIEQGQLISGNFPQVFEHDLSLTSDQLGGPVFDLEGMAIGITIASAGNHGCLGLTPHDINLFLVRKRSEDAVK